MSETDPGKTSTSSSSDDFAARLAAARGRRDAGRETTSDVAARNTGQLGLGFRIAVDLLAGVAVGTGMGLALDRWLGTSPWLLLVFLMLGFAAGMTNMLRTVRANDAARARGERAAGPGTQGRPLIRRRARNGTSTWPASDGVPVRM
jgi:ATP synthase protein I